MVVYFLLEESFFKLLIDMEGFLMRVNITLQCTECKDKNYISTKNKGNNPDRLEMKKYCPRERKMTMHREEK